VALITLGVLIAGGYLAWILIDPEYWKDTFTGKDKK
jgi:hypothetical protein